MKTRIITTIFALVLAVLCSPPGVFASEPLVLHVSLSTDHLGQGEDITVNVTVSATDDQKRQFRIGSFAECFGVYILGPWGVVQPDLTKVRPENWMHGEHSASAVITMEEGKPFSTTFKLSDYFRTDKPTKQVPGTIDGFLPGKHQMNIKFFANEPGLSEPIDSGPVVFTVGKDLGTKASSVRGDPRR